MKVHATNERRAKAALVSLVLVSLLSVVRSVIESPGARRVLRMPDLKQYETRFVGVRTALTGREAIGYFDDEPDPRYELGDYYATQYVLTPAIVLHSEHVKLVIGNFVCASCPKRSWPSDLLPVRDFGQGVILFEKKDR